MKSMSESDKSVELDMQKHDAYSRGYIWKIYSKNALIGNEILPDDQKIKLFKITKGYIDKLLRDSSIPFDKEMTMQITLAVITYAKEWDHGDESGFWRYITAQFGYRDDKEQVRSILCTCISKAIKENRRWFFETKSGSQYKSTIVIHALAPKRSWMYLYDFLFDFYKTNMEWTYIKNDPIIPRMVSALRNKLIPGDAAEEDNLEISNKVYLFQEGIRKLIIYRNSYAVHLLSRMIRRIDGIINSSNKPAKYYVDVLCDEWMEGRLQNARDARVREGHTAVRNVAIDYSRIYPKYNLVNNVPVISFPDIRVKSSDFEKASIKVYTGETLALEKVISYYGNELGKTLIGFDLDLGICVRNGDGTFQIRIQILCDEEIIYDSCQSLYRDCLFFSKKSEIDIEKLKRDSYVLIIPQNTSVDFTSTDFNLIEDNLWCKAYYITLQKGFTIKSSEKIFAYDNDDMSDTSRIRIIYPSYDSTLQFLQNGQHYKVLTKPENILLLASEPINSQRYQIILNQHRISLDSLLIENRNDKYLYQVPMEFDEDDICEFQLVDIAKNLLVAKSTFKLINELKIRFDKPYYFDEKEYQNAFLRISSGFGDEILSFEMQDEHIQYSIAGGELEIKPPRIEAREKEGRLWNPNIKKWIKDIEQDEKILISAPDNCNVFLQLGNLDVVNDGKGCFDYGNAVMALSASEEDKWIDITLLVEYRGYRGRYIIGKLTAKERFQLEPAFSYHDGSLFWNMGGGFLGNTNEKMLLRLFSHDRTVDIPLSITNEKIEIGSDLALGKYDYQIVKISRSIFKAEEKVLDEGKLTLGDANDFRFIGYKIRIKSITFEEDGILRRIKIDNTFIDQIEYLGMHEVSSEERRCPIYQGIMYYVGPGYERYDFSFSDVTGDNGRQLYKVNPVKIIFLNESTISITNQDGDGLYYHRYLNRNMMQNYYAVTDIEPVWNQKDIYLADLYTYEKERI